MSRTSTPVVSTPVVTETQIEPTPAELASAAVAALPTEAAYAAGDGAFRKSARENADIALRAAMTAGDSELGMAVFTLKDAYAKHTGKAAKAPVTVDYQSLVRDRIATLSATILLLQSGRFNDAPDGFRWDGDTTGRTIDMTAARTMAKVTRAKKADLGGYLAAVLDTEWKTVSEVRKAVIEAAREAGDDYTPGDGAIAARFFGAKGVIKVTLKGAEARITSGARQVRMVPVTE